MWAGRVVRMEQRRIPKKVLGSCFGGGRPVRRPRNKWEDAIQRDVASLPRIRNWKSVARNKEEWRKKVWGRHGPKTGQSAVEEEEEAEKILTSQE
jgi:hypothetical protein